MINKYDPKFPEVMKRCFDTLYPKIEYVGCIIPTMSAITCLWFADPAVIEKVLKDQEVVRQRLLDRLDENKIEEFAEERMKYGWSTNLYINAIKLYGSILTEEECEAMFEDDRSDEVTLCD